MDKIQVVSHKPRSSSAESTASSVTEYVNEVFADSELELSKVVSIQVSKDLTYVTNPLEAIPNIDDVKTQKQLQNFGDTFAESSAELTPKRFRWMYIVALVVLMFPVSMGLTATYSSTATEDMKKRHSSIHPTDDEVSWIGSLLTIGALVGGSVGVVMRKLFVILSILMFSTSATSVTSFEEDEIPAQYPRELRPSFRQLLIQRVFQPTAIDDISKLREAGLKRAHVRGFDQLPPGFVGVRGKKSEKVKVKEPFPGFLGVRGKKSYLDGLTFRSQASSITNHQFPAVIPLKNLEKYLQSGFLKIRNSAFI